MILESLTISPKMPYSAPSPTNPYEATLSVSYNDTKMKVKLPNETATKILNMCAEEIGRAAQTQIDDFVRAALQASSTPLIDHEKDIIGKI